MITILTAALMLAGQAAATKDSPDPHLRATIFSTLGHSEWCPAGNVGLDLGTGGYALTPRASRRVCNDPDLARPVENGHLDATALAAVRAAYRRAQAQGLDACRTKGRRQLIVSNGGRPILVLTSGVETIAAPDDRSCWSEAAHALHRVLDDAFRSSHQR